jgi:hypothetical protein
MDESKDREKRWWHVAEMTLRNHWSALVFAKHLRQVHSALAQAALRRVRPSLVSTVLEREAPELIKKLAEEVRPHMLAQVCVPVARSLGIVEVCYTDALALLDDGHIRKIRRRKMPPLDHEALDLSVEFDVSMGEAVELTDGSSAERFVISIDGPAEGRVAQIHEDGRHSLVRPCEADVLLRVDLTTPSKGGTS